MSSSFYRITAENRAPMAAMINEINARLASNGECKIALSQGKISRSYQQNRTMRMWFEDIHSVEGGNLWEVAGRCKLAYFVPVLMNSERTSDSEADIKVRLFQELWKGLLPRYTYEEQIKILGYGLQPSTSLLNVREFSAALHEMHTSESNIMRDPALMGLTI